MHRGHDSIFNINRVMGLCHLLYISTERNEIFRFKMLCRKLLLHLSKDFNETLHMHALGCAGVHDTIFSLIGLTMAEL